MQLNTKQLQWSSWMLRKECYWRSVQIFRVYLVIQPSASSAFKPPPLLLRLPLPPQHPSAVTWWTWNELFAESASSSFWLSHEYWVFFPSLFFFADDLTLLYPFFESDHMGVLTALLLLKRLHCTTRHNQRQRLNLTAVISAAPCAPDLITKAEGVEKQTGVFFSLYYPVMVC